MAQQTELEALGGVRLTATRASMKLDRAAVESGGSDAWRPRVLSERSGSTRNRQTCTPFEEVR